MVQVLVTSFKKQNGKIDKMHKEKKEIATPERAPKFTFARAFLSCLKRSQNPSFLTHGVQKTRVFCAKQCVFCRGKQVQTRFLRCCFAVFFICSFLRVFSLLFLLFGKGFGKGFGKNLFQCRKGRGYPRPPCKCADFCASAGKPRAYMRE